MSKVLACVDASAYSASVCDHAAWAAGLLSEGVTLLHVLDRAPDSVPADLSGSIGLGAQEELLEDLARLDEQRGRLRMARGRAILAEGERRIREAGLTDVHSRLRHGGLVDSVHELEGEARLVVLGKRGERADFARLHLGGSVEQVVRASQLPVLVASRAFRAIRRIAVAFDGGSSARKAVEYLTGDARFAGIDCHLVTAGGERAELAGHLDWARERMEARGGPYEMVRRTGAPETAIVDYVKEAEIDLLVMGAYGHSPIRRFIVGSTTTSVVRTCMVPVLLFR